VKNEQEECVRKAQASRLALESWSRKRDLGSGNPRPQRSVADGETHCDSSCKIDLEGPRVWQTLETRWMAKFRVGQTLSWRTREGGNTLA